MTSFIIFSLIWLVAVAWLVSTPWRRKSALQRAAPGRSPIPRGKPGAKPTLASITHDCRDPNRWWVGTAVRNKPANRK